MKYWGLLVLVFSTSVIAHDSDPIWETESKFPNEFKYHAVTVQEKSELKQVTRVAKAFADSGILGTGATETFSGVMDISGNEAIAFGGASDDEVDGVMTYKINLQKINGKWKVISFENGAVGSSRILKAGIERMLTAYPSLQLDGLVEGNGRVGYYKQFPKELDRTEVPVTFPQFGDVRYLTMDIINKYAKDGIVIGHINKQFIRPGYSGPLTEVVVYGRSEQAISKYRADLDNDIREVFINDATTIQACGKPIVKAKLAIPLRNEKLIVPDPKGKLNISFENEGKRFSCNIDEQN